MTVSTTSNKVSFSANGSTTVFAYNFKIFADADLTVIIRSSTGAETTKTLTTHYTVSGAGSASGGNVTFTSGNTPADGETVVIQRQLTKTQGTDYVANDPFPAESHEDALDRLTFITQELQEEVDRSIKASVTNVFSNAEFTTSATDRANKVFAFDGSGDLAVTQELGTFRGNWAASTAYAVRDLVKDTSTNNIFIVNTAHTSSGSQPLTSNANSSKYDLIVDAATATSAQTAAASSASSASTSASTATTKASEAATSATNAASSASTATTKASEASTSASNASTSESNASSSASSASTSASTATTKASEASTSATNAASSASTATTKASEAATSATNAASSASTASTQASNASTSASTATTKASEASTSATNAASSATAAASSATAAASSQTAAAASAASAASAFDNFDDTYLGSKTSNPTVDNDGDALVAGALYFNSTANEMRVYDGANWIAATSAGNVSLILYEYTATAGQTTFSGSDDNSATLSYTADNLQVVMNGVILDPSDFTATNGTSVVLASGAAANDLVNIYAFKSFTTADMVSKTNGGAFQGNVDFGAGIDVTGDITVTGTVLPAGDTSAGDNAAIGYTAAEGLILTGQGSTSDVTIKNDADATVAFVPTGADDLRFPDNAELQFGDSADLKIYHNGSTSFIEDVGTGNFLITTNGNNIQLMKQQSEQMLVAKPDDAVELYYDNVKKVETSSTGAFVAGKLDVGSVGASGGTAGTIAFGGVGGSIDGFQIRNTEGNYLELSAVSSGNKVVMTNTGSLGIGTASPSTKLELNNGATGSLVTFTDGVATNFTFKTDGSNVGTFGTEAGSTHLAFMASGTERMRISTGGNVRFFQTSADSPGLGNNTTGHTFQPGGIVAFSSANAYVSINRNGDGARMQFNNSGTTRGTITVSGTTTAYNTSSDRRLKSNIQDAASASAKIDAMKVRQFDWTEDGKHQDYGMIAQELQSIEPLAVSGSEDSTEMMGVDYSILVPMLIKEIQELRSRVAALEE